ncbi:MAG: hypothetical protein LBU68_00755, partial [Rickettsiales bacterium]|nr:hypothetical protein [Rickettsiales bacterium]
MQKKSPTKTTPKQTEKKQNLKTKSSAITVKTISTPTGFSVIDTTFAKGIAIIFLLFHHLFYLQPKMGLML